jgi:hypothetical protein
MSKTIEWKRFFVLNQLSPKEHKALPLELGGDPTYGRAVAIEVARQLSDNGGLPMSTAAKVCLNTAAVAGYFKHGEGSGLLSDYWVGIVQSRNSWNESVSRSWVPVTNFGEREYWATTHYGGSLAEVYSWMTYEMVLNEQQHPDSDPARIFMANVSAADRRLRKRAAELGIEIDGNEFA